MIRTRALALTASLAVLLAACGADGADRQISKVFIAPPWTADEVYTYGLTRVEDDEPYGECELRTRLNAEASNTRLDFLCSDGSNRDDGTALVEAATLRPLTSNRTVIHPEDEERLSFSSFYEPPIVRYVSDENGKTRETVRDLPVPDETSPDPGYYDDVSLLWVVRGLKLEEGYEASFQNIAAGTGQTFRVDVEVERVETVTVPAGEFEAWRIRLRTASVTNLYWVETDAPHRLIKARIRGIQDQNYELLPPQ